MALKKRTVLSSITLGLFLFVMVFPMIGMASLTKYDTATTTTSLTENYDMVTIVPQKSMYATIQIDSNLPGVFTSTDYWGAVINTESVADSADPSLNYPVRLNTNIGYQRTYGPTAKADAKYVKTANNSINDFGNYQVSLIADKYIIAPGKIVEFPPLDFQMELDILVEDAGIYQIWYSLSTSGGTPTITVSGINSPSDKVVNFQSASLPNAYGTTTPLGRYIYFAAFEQGYYKMYFTTTNTALARFECKYLAPSPIELAKSYSGGVTIGSDEYTNPTYMCKVYSFSISAKNFYKYSFVLDYGNPTVSLFYNAPYISERVALATGANLILDGKYSCQVFLVVDNPSYFTWGTYGAMAPTPMKFSVRFTSLTPSRHTLGSSEQIVVSPGEILQGKYFELSKPAVVSLQFETIGTYSPTIYFGAPYIERILDGQIDLPGIYETVHNSGGKTFVNVLCEPGYYKIGFQTQNPGYNEYMKFNTTVTYTTTSNVVVKDPNEPLLSSQFTNIQLANWRNCSDTEGNSLGNAVIVPIDENFRNFGFNITLEEAQNQAIFDQTLTPELGFMYDDDGAGGAFTDYTSAIQSGNVALAPLKTDETDYAGDGFVIGCQEKFDSIIVDISTAANSDNWTWQYLSAGATWLPFVVSTHSFSDGTRTASGSLRQDGRVSWNPALLTSWNYRDATTNSTASCLPDTDDLPMYLIRVICNDTIANIPRVDTFSLKRWVRIYSELEVEFGFDTKFLSTSNYVTFTGVLDWMAGQYATKQTKATIADEAFNANINFHYKNAFLFLSAQDLNIVTYVGSNTGLNRKFNSSLVFSVCVYRLDNWVQFNHAIGSNIPSVHSSQVNFTTFTGYTNTYSYNASEPNIASVFIKMTPKRLYDWTQVIMHTVNGDITNLVVWHAFETNAYAIQADSYYDDPITPSANNNTWEWGFITDYVLVQIMLDGLTLNPAYNTDIALYAGQFNYPQITFTVANPFIWQDWYTWTIVGGAVAVVVLLVLWKLHKKRNPF